MTRLLTRLFEAERGSVRVCGCDVRRVTQRSLRTVISCVSQDTVLFNDTIRFNLLYGRRAAPTLEPWSSSHPSPSPHHPITLAHHPITQAHQPSPSREPISPPPPCSRRDATAAQLGAACALARVDGYLATLEAGLETLVGQG